jgi:outer membrane protein OmpA-like peptidoglycan-associated protein
VIDKVGRITRVMLKKFFVAAELLLALATPARAEVWFGAEAPLAVAISDGQRGVFRPGLLPAAGVYLESDVLSIGARVRAGFLRDGAPPTDDREDPSTGGLLSGVLAARMKFGNGLWLEGASGVGMTGDSIAPTFELAAGLSFANEYFELGPSVRYVQVHSIDKMDSFGTAELLLVGLDVRFGGKPVKHSVRRAVVAEAPPPVAAPEPAIDVDRDDDTVVDLDQSCLQDLSSCPLPEGMEVQHDRIILDERVLFDFNRARVRSGGRKLVRAIVALWAHNTTWGRITIEGHADVRGTEDYNLALSERRAQKVRDLMVEMGSNPFAVDSIGLGKSRPRDTGTDEHAHERNRRVEFVIERRGGGGRVEAGAGVGTPDAARAASEVIDRRLP